jgi:beta-glucosidase
MPKLHSLAWFGAWLGAWLGLFACGCKPSPLPPGVGVGGPPLSAPAPTAIGGAPLAPASAAPASADRRADEWLTAMTLEEKIDYIGGDRDFYIRPLPRLGIPEIKMSDGPSGCRNWGPSTAYPAAVALAAAFDTSLAERVGQSIGRDCRARGVRILLAPGVNIQRSPLNGRNFEYLGEDPFLAGQTAAAYVRGVQGEGVVATVKHFAANNQEWNRRGISSEVDERTLREIYFPAFERVVREGHVGAAMTAYNLLNGTYCSENAWLVRTVLKGQWGFEGIVMSDWHAVQDAAGAANAGLDLEMPEARYMNRDRLIPLLRAHTVDTAAIDDKVRRILRTIAAAGFVDSPAKRDDVPLDDPRSSSVALDEARRSVVLLKNQRATLPLDRSQIRRIALIGPNATPAVVGGSGSAFVTPFHAESLLSGLARIARGIEIDYHPGVRQVPGGGLQGGDEVSAIAKRADVVILSVGYGQNADSNSSQTAFEPFWPPPWARQAGLVEAENSDRPFELPAPQLETIRRALASNPRTVVVVNAGGGVDLQTFVDRAAAIVWAWYPGQEGGRAIAEVLFGDVNPSGKLPVTFGKRYSDYPSAPYYNSDQDKKTPYTEGIFVGYRGFEAARIEPAFPFGFGLSYTAFDYSDLHAEAAADGSANVTVTVTNRGKRTGDEIVQIYVAPPKSPVPRPPKELEGFVRVSLEPGQSKPVSLTLEPRAFAFWDGAAGRFAVTGGAYEILAASSSSDVRLRQPIQVAARTLPP